MALFGGNKETKEEKQARQVQEMLVKYGMDDLSDERDITAVKQIASELYGSNVAEFGMLLSSKAEDVWKISYLRAIIEQNWIIIRQLDRLNKNLEK